MPFEVFRRHQRKLLAIFAILAMFGFVVSDSLPKLLNSSTAGAISRSSNSTARRSIGATSTRCSSSGRYANHVRLRAEPLPRPDSVRRTLKDRDMVDA